MPDKGPGEPGGALVGGSVGGPEGGPEGGPQGARGTLGPYKGALGALALSGDPGLTMKEKHL